MSDPLTLTAGALITLATQKFVESSSGELAKKFTTEAISKITELWHLIKGKLLGKSAKVDAALEKVETGDLSVVETLVKNLDVLMDDDETFAELLWKLAKGIDAGQIKQIGLEDVTANRVAAEIKQKASGDRVEQIGVRKINAAGDAVFKIDQIVN